MGSFYIKTFFIPFPLSISCPTLALAIVLLNGFKRFSYQELLCKSDLKLMEEALWIRDAADAIAGVCETIEQGERQELVTGLLIELGENHKVSISNKLPVSLMLMCLSSDKGQKAPRPRSQKLALCCWLTAPLANSGKRIKISLIKATKERFVSLVSSFQTDILGMAKESWQDHQFVVQASGVCAVCMFLWSPFWALTLLFFLFLSTSPSKHGYPPASAHPSKNNSNTSTCRWWRKRAVVFIVLLAISRNWELSFLS